MSPFPPSHIYTYIWYYSIHYIPYTSTQCSMHCKMRLSLERLSGYIILPPKPSEGSMTQYIYATNSIIYSNSIMEYSFVLLRVQPLVTSISEMIYHPITKLAQPYKVFAMYQTKNHSTLSSVTRNKHSPGLLASISYFV